MTIERVNWKQIIDEWEHDPHKALLWILQRFWEAGISPNDAMVWQVKNKEIIIGDLKHETVNYTGINHGNPKIKRKTHPKKS